MVQTGMTSAVAIAVETQLRGGRHSQGDATQLHHSITSPSPHPPSDFLREGDWTFKV